MNSDKKLDDQIRELRRLTRKSEDVDEIYHYFELLDKAQRRRLAEVGSFLPCKNNKIFAYSPEEDIWLNFNGT